MPSWTKLIQVKKSPVASTRRYHHIGIPTTERREGERLIEHHATFVSGYETSAYGIEWMRFVPEAPVPELVRTVPHVAFEVDDLSAEIAGKEILKCAQLTFTGRDRRFYCREWRPRRV